MLDTQTESEWSQLLGKAMKGPMVNSKLTQLPAVIVDWKSWREMHPQTTVAMLKKTSTEYSTNFIQDRSNYLLGTNLNGQSQAYAFDLLIHQPVVNATFQNVPVLVLFDEPSNTAFLYDRRIGDRTLEFRSEKEHVRDSQTKTTWAIKSGRAIEGPLDGETLTRIPAVVSLRSAWERFHPKTNWWKPSVLDE